MHDQGAGRHRQLQLQPHQDAGHAHRLRSQLKEDRGIVSCCIWDCWSKVPLVRLFRSMPWQ